MGPERHINYCALTTISTSMKQFVLPSLIKLSHNGYRIFVGCKNDEGFEKSLPEDISFLPLDIERGYNLKKTLKTIGLLYRFFKNNKIDMVEYGTENVSFCAAIAAWAACVPVRIYNHWGARYIGYSGLSRQISLLIERTAALFSSTIRQQSNKNMQLCIHDHVYPEHKVSVIGYGGTIGVDFTRFDISKKSDFKKEVCATYNIPDDAIIFGDVGSIRKDKGSNELITAFRALNNPKTQLLMVGAVYPEDMPDTELLAWAEASDRVIFTGYVTDVERYVSAFDFIVHPSYREGLGMVLQEAGALGVPYITTDIPGPSEFGIDGETGFIVKKGDAGALKEKMEYVCLHRELHQSLSKSVYDLTRERYERNRMIDRLLEDRNKLWEKMKKH